MPKGVTRRRPRTRAALLKAALETFAEHGFHATTIEQICERAGYTRGAYYSNFASKEELFLALFDEHSDRTVRRLAEAIDALSVEEYTLTRLAELAARVEPDERDWYLVTTEFTLHAIRDPQAAWVLARHDERLRAEIARGLTLVLRRAGRELTVDADRFARLLIALREGGLAQSYVEPEVLPPGSLERQFLAPLLEASTREIPGQPDQSKRSGSDAVI
ncbi:MULTISPECIES: TetR/AcrR family transcriptional regulator [Streptomyces]|uniref:TetR/AcrR family transcriptional regulator n=1 Tax=Streptomyces TaxID=1883 RepID=UPI00093C6B22|nr:MULTISPECIES: TetR/AcrR family transcriptional regulator [Streptomyces]MBX9427104.1 TetR/AcrR family transcriptional regulator; helix-turn-helix transcriptional regulator [Streptomyces lateritius]OKJ62741.1 TetR family transcriptional regulator [Streptomyces sp. CB02261]